MTKIIFLAALLFSTQTFFSQIVADLIIKDVNIIPLTKDTLIVKKSVAIFNGKILEINDFKKIKKNDQTKIVEGANKYVMPSLTEMHIHLPNPSKMDTFLNNLVAAGVTHVRAMYSDQAILDQRKLIESKTIKPKVYYPYLLTTNTNVRTEKQIDSLFTVVKKDKLDFVKLYSIQHRNDFNDTIFDRIMASADKKGLIVCGHYPSKISLDKVLRSGFKSIEHLAGYVDLPENRIEKAMDLTKQYNVYNCPTLDWDVMAYDLPYPNDYHNRLIMANAPKHYIDAWDANLASTIKRIGAEKIEKDKTAYLPTFEKKKRLLKLLNKNNTLLILGGESENLFQLEGFNMYEEMAHWQVAGISNYEILKAAIVNPAKFFNEDKMRGTMELGKEANLVLLNENPLADIKNIKTIYTTIMNGKVYLKSELVK